MAIRGCWSFDDTQVLADRGLSGSAVIATTQPRTGAQSLKLQGGGTPNRAIFPTFGGYAVGATIGFAFGYRPSWPISAPSNTPAGAWTYHIVSFWGEGIQHCSIGLDADGKVQAVVAAGTQTGASVTPCAYEVYAHWEVKYVCHDSAGSIVVKINGVEYMNVSGIDTRTGGAGTLDAIQIGSQQGSNSYFAYADDCVLWDTSGSDVTDFIGDMAVLYRKASGAGNYAAWTPSAGSNYQNVDDLGTPDEDTTYNSSSTASQKDSFAIDDIAAGTVIAVQSVIRARKDDAGSRSVRPLFRIGGSDYVGATVSLSDGYVTSTEVFHNDPSDTNDWTSGDVNGAEHGYELVA